MSTTVVTPETVVDQTVTSTQATPVDSQQSKDRKQIYEQYYGANPTQDSAPGTTLEPTAQVGTSTEVAPPVAGMAPEIKAAFDAMQAELVALRQAVKPTVPVDTTHEPEPSWVALLREGRVEEAEKALVEQVAKKVAPDTIEQSVARAREVARAEAEIEAYVKDLRTQNPDLVPLERYIAVEANETLARLQAEGKIKTTEDTVREYKKAVSDAKDNARKLFQAIRGSGKQEAMVRSREVLSTSAIPPNSVDTQRQQVQQGTQEPFVESPEQYFERRRAVDNWRKGLAPRPEFLKE